MRTAIVTVVILIVAWIAYNYIENIHLGKKVEAYVSCFPTSAAQHLMSLNYLESSFCKGITVKAGLQ